MKSFRFVCPFSLFVLTLLPARVTAQVPAPVRFTSTVPYDSGGHAATSVAIGDLNGDGSLDFVVANNHCPGTKDCFPGDGQVAVLLRNVDGTLQVLGTYAVGGYPAMALAIGDVNNDGKLDLVVATRCTVGGKADCPDQQSLLTVLLGNGDATFRAGGTYPSGGSYVSSVAIGDVSGDGYADIVVANSCETPCNGLYPPGLVSVLLNNADGTFQAPVSYGSGGWVYRSIWSPTTSVAIGDVNGDSKPDLVVTNGCGDSSCATGGGVGVLIGNGGGTFQSAITYRWEVGGVQQPGVVIGDFNGDGKQDLAVTGEDYLSVLIGNGDSTFQSAVTYHVGGLFGASVAVGDVNGDGHPDLITVSYMQSPSNQRGVVSVLPGHGDGTFQSAVTYDSGGSIGISIVIGDVDGDRKPDLVVANYCSGATCAKDGTVRLLLNTLIVSTTTTVTSSPNPSKVNEPTTILATVTSSSSIPDGSIITFYRGTTQIGTGAARDGIATFTTSFSKAKTYTIKAKYAGDAFHRASSGAMMQVVQ